MRLASLLAASCLAVGCQTTVAPKWPVPDGVSTLPVNGYPLAYVSRGTGPTLVLLHGGLSDYRTWQPQMDGLASEFRVVTVALRHFYPERWDGKGDTFTYRQHADDTAKLIETLGAPGTGAKPAKIVVVDRSS